jgi:nucleoid-associated protein YgaU
MLMSKHAHDQGDGSLESAPSALPEPIGPAGPNIGREIKIGVAVILVLLIVFGAVLYRRLTQGTAHPIAEDRSQERRAGGFDGGSSQPTVVTATAGSSRSSRRISVAEMAQTPWSGGSDGAAADKNDGFSPRKPSFMPPLPPTDTGGGAWPKHKHDGDASRVSLASANEGDGGSPPAKKGDAGPNPFAQIPPLPPATFVSSGKASPVQPDGRTPYGGGDAANPLRDSSAAPIVAAGGTVPGALPGNGGYGDVSSGSSPAAGSVPGDNGAQSPAAANAALAASDPVVSPPAYGSAGAVPGAGMTAGAFSSPYGGSGAPHIYTVQPNDNYWKISEKVYGTGAYFQALAEQNRKKIPDENRLRPGDTVSIPPVGELEKKYAALCPKPDHRDTTRRQLATVSTVSPVSQVGGGRVYVVQEGDNLYDIARWELGKVTRWPEIYDLNREALGSDPDHLTPGMRLVLPGDRPGGVNKVAGRPDDTVYRR